jgi:hypothetical protein
MKLSKIFSAVAVLLTLFVGISIAQLGNDWKPTTGETWQRTNPDGSTHNYTVLYSPSSVRRSGSIVSADMETIFVDSTPNVVYGTQYNCSTRQYTFAGYDLSVNPPVLGQVSVWKDVQPNTTGATLLPFFCRYQQTAAPVPYGLKLTSYKAVANLDYHKGFTVDAPVTLTTDGPTQGTTNQGRPFTQTTYAGGLPNDDTYMVSVCDYGFALSDADLDRGTDGFAGGINGTVTSRRRVTVSGYTAAASVIESVKNGRTMRFGLLIVIRGNSAYMFVFGTWLDTTGTNMADVETFFKSAALN